MGLGFHFLLFDHHPCNYMHDIQLLIKKVDCVYVQHQYLDCFLISINSIYCTQKVFFWGLFGESLTNCVNACNLDTTFSHLENPRQIIAGKSKCNYILLSYVLFSVYFSILPFSLISSYIALLKYSILPLINAKL